MTFPPQGIEEGEFDRIEAAVRETERGRWFLDEFARRVRASETASLQSAIERLERRAASLQAGDDQTRHHIQRVISLLAALVDHLNAHKADAPFHRAEPAGLPPVAGDPEWRLRAFASVDALSVADKLKLFR